MKPEDEAALLGGAPWYFDFGGSPGACALRLEFGSLEPEEAARLVPWDAAAARAISLT